VITPRTGSETPLRRELLLSFSLLLGAALLVATVAILLVLPLADRPGQAVSFIVVLIAADLTVIALFGRWILRRAFVGPVERMVEDAERISEGEYSHRIARMPGAELEAIRASVNALADRLVQDQARLAENVRSLDQTNAELVATRNELIQSARLASVGTLAAGIAHEVGNPLGALMGFADVAKSRAEEAGHDTELIRSIRSEAERIDRIIRTLLQYARGRPDGQAGPVPIAMVADRVRELLDSQGKLADVDVSWPGEVSVPEVFGHAQQLEQVLLNLILNAIDALEDTDRPHIEVTLASEQGGFSRLPARRDDDPEVIDYTHRRRVASDLDLGGPDSLFTANEVVVLRVSDNGPGIAETDLDRVFDPFFTTKAPGKGTGLGLAICARLVEGMGGRILAGSAEGGGALFEIRLPAMERLSSALPQETE